MSAGKRLRGPFAHFGGYAWIADASMLTRGDCQRDPFRSVVLLHEDGKPLYGAHATHDAIRQWGHGLYSHWESTFFFSASDNTNPNTNGRSYSLADGLTIDVWNDERWRAATAGWSFHPRGAYFLQCGGATVAPPIYCNLPLTNKCNLRCEICGSQKYLDETGVRRRHMDFGLFQHVAETLFPFIYEVELNSQGDPLLHPRIADILSSVAQYNCNVKIQTNGTLFSDRVIEILKQQFGFIMLSLDAIGPRFDEVRRGGNWKLAEPQLRKFLATRDPRRLRVGIYPTITRRTVRDAVDITEWAGENGVEAVYFHSYVPIQNSTEEVPTADELRQAAANLLRWLGRRGNAIEVELDGTPLNKTAVADRRTEFASARKREHAMRLAPGYMFPRAAGAPHADPISICASPRAYVEIGLDGQISACCRAQDVCLGYATSVEQFADAWFGRSYQLIRQSLTRKAIENFPLVNCASCIEMHAPEALMGREAIDYTAVPRPENALDFGDLSYLRLEAIQREFKHCHVSRIPLGIDGESFALYEDDVPLGPGKQLHDDIRLRGSGRFSIWGQAVYFSSSDNSDARINGRSYSLRRTSAVCR